MAGIAKSPGKATGESGFAHTKAALVGHHVAGGEVLGQTLGNGFGFRGAMGEEFHGVYPFVSYLKSIQYNILLSIEQCLNQISFSSAEEIVLCRPCRLERDGSVRYNEAYDIGWGNVG